MLNKVKGNMYSFFNNYPFKGANRGCTWNPIKGKCPHDCSYCFMKRFPQKELRLDEKCFKDNLGRDRYIFVGSSTDMWGTHINQDWIRDVLIHCYKYPDNQYFFQSKNPERFSVFKLPDNFIICTTIETDKQDILDKHSLLIYLIKNYEFSILM
ncbi:unnamed protein product, partial [marine sediment metagenome]